MGTGDTNGPLFNMKSGCGWDFPQETFYISDTSVEISESEWPGKASAPALQVNLSHNEREAGEMEILNLRL